MVDFQASNKCAASSGRYLENMAAALGISLDELAQHYENPVTLSSTCAIFGESEVIGCLAEGKPIETICAGVNYSVVRRVMPDVRRMQSPHYILSGGVASNAAVRRLLEQELQSQVIVPQHHFFLGAIGCCTA
jgi:predicted CoA-substrate-specific enzyme activase